MLVFRSLCSALLMYSRIPVPQVEWKEENRRYALCFFPVVGAVIGVLLLGWQRLCVKADFGTGLFAAVSVLIPLLVTGGIHMDGFCDVLDAKSSYASKEKRLQIMSDPHLGAFAVMGAVIYFLLQFGLFTELENSRALWVAAGGYPLSRALSGLAAVTFPCAKKEGTLQDFSKPAHKKKTIIILTLFAMICMGAMIFCGWAENRFAGLAAVILAGVSFGHYYRFAEKTFGGITGDVAGWFVQVCELAILAGTVIATVIVRGAIG